MGEEKERGLNEIWVGDTQSKSDYEARMKNSLNPYQGVTKRILCVCSAGLLRSPTAAEVLQEEYGYNTRSAGTDFYALIPVDGVLLNWANEIVVMQRKHEVSIRRQYGGTEPLGNKRIICLDIKDEYEFRSPELKNLIIEKYEKLTT